MKQQPQQNSTSPADGRACRVKRRRESSQSSRCASMKSKVFVIEDHPLMRRSLVEAIGAIVSAQPDVVLTDIQLKSSSGLELIKALHAHTPALPVIATSMFDVRRNERLARAVGASGFVAKQDGPAKLIAVVRESLKSVKKGGDAARAEDE